VGCAAPTGNILPLQFATLVGQRYQVEFKRNLSDPVWTPLGDPVVGDGGVQQIDDNIAGQPQRFYHLVVLP
jgi:hypothetical protein